MEFLNWLTEGRNWEYVILTLLIIGFAVEGIIRAARDKG